MAVQLGSGEYTFEVNENWAKVPEEIALGDCAAVGVDRHGNLLYVAADNQTVSSLAHALVHAGAVRAMELDINPEWIQLAIAHTPGGSLRAPIPGQVRPATQYLTGWTRDFITVLAPR